MKTYKSLGILMMLAALVFMVSCTTSESLPVGITDIATDDYQNLDLNKDFGGLTFNDEEAGFGDSYFALADFEDLDAESDDPMLDDPLVQGYERMHRMSPDSTDAGRPVITALRIVWGQLDGDPEGIIENYDLLDWSGALEMDRGVVLVRRLVLFERPRDHLLRPRDNRRSLGWVSRTGPHYDGLIVEIIEPPLDPDTNSPPANILHFTTPLFERDFVISDFGGLNQTYRIDDAGNAIRFEGYRLGDEDLCPKGFLRGIWVDHPDRDGGFFKGRWVGFWGNPLGHFRGGYGINDAGEHVFFGKYINRRGYFAGLLEGTWEPGPVAGEGLINGRWVGRDASTKGTFSGAYMQVSGRPGGYLSGRWATLCAGEIRD